MLRILPILICFLGAFPVFGAIDVLHYHIQLHFREMTEERIAGFTDVRFKRTAKDGELRLELLDLKVEKVEYLKKNIALTFSQKDTRLSISITKMADADTGTVRIHYSGQPGKPSYFGGIYYSQDFIYNLGVAIDRIPHCYGKVWFPCVDDFTDKATYSFNLRVPKGKTAVCNGSMIKKETHDDGSASFHWALRDPICTYLASFAVGDYVAVEDIYKGNKGDIPITLYVAPGKEQAARGSFRNLKSALRWYENYFGTYEWERVGYVAVPMTGGAMEHATNIAYPKNFIDSTMSNDRLWAHELAHSWFGNLVTCSSAGDMWLNEGFARWAEAFYQEMLDGKDGYQKYIRNIVASVCSRTHVRDEGYFAVAGVPEKITYGSTVYDKGALVVHSLRGQLGDSVFFKGIRKYMNEYRFRSATTDDFRKVMESVAGLKLDAFFKTWITTPGYVFWRMEELSIMPQGRNFVSSALLVQEVIQKTGVADGSKVELLLLGKNGERKIQPLIISSKRTRWMASTTFQPERILIDPEDRMADAAAQSYFVLSTRTEKTETPGCTLTVKKDTPLEPTHVWMRYCYFPPLNANVQYDQFQVGNRYWEVLPAKESPLPVTMQFTFLPKDFFTTAVFEMYTLNPSDTIPLSILYRKSETAQWESVAVIRDYREALKDNKPLQAELPNFRAGQYAVGFLLKR